MALMSEDLKRALVHSDGQYIRKFQDVVEAMAKCLDDQYLGRPCVCGSGHEPRLDCYAKARYVL